jgi:hypothetical protein
MTTLNSVPSGLLSTVDTTGTLNIQTNSINALAIDTNQNATMNYVSAQNTFGFKNRIINGAMNIWQRNTSYTNSANANGYNTADRWNFFSGLGLPGVVSQASTGLQNFPYAIRAQRPSGNSSTANMALIQPIESINCRDLAGQTVTLSFQARCGSNYSPTNNGLVAAVVSGSGTDQGAGNLINSAWTSQLGQTTTVALTTSFQTYTYTITIPSGTNEVAVQFYNYPTGTAGTNDYFDVTAVQLEKGNIATPFEFRDYGRELILCQRYYAASYAYQQTYITSSGVAGISVPLPVTMRAAPTYTTLADASGNLSGANYTVGGGYPASYQVALLYSYGAAIGQATLSVSFKAVAEL